MARSRRTPIVLNKEDRKRLERIKTNPHSILKHVQRATFVLHLGDVLTQSQTMRATGMSKPTVWRWWDRVLVEGAGGPVYDIPRRRDRKPISEDEVSELIELEMSSCRRRKQVTGRCRRWRKRWDSPGRRCSES